ncbi:MAG: hypothetical protein ACI4PZ_01495 [Akkermansia sp.]
MLRTLLLLLLALALLPAAAAPQLKVRRHSSARAPLPWSHALQGAMVELQRHGAGGYSTDDTAKQALKNAFRWDEVRRRPRFDARTARPSFCSAAVYAAVLSALLRWEESRGQRLISPEAWQALLPQLVPDGVGAWGYANANGPGYALLIARLGAGVSFTDWAQARPGDVAKLWWNDAIGAGERGHLVVLVQDEGEQFRFWSANMARDGQNAGYGIRRLPKSAVRRVLFTRITQPAAFNNAARLPNEPWLTKLMRSDTDWPTCCAMLRLQTRRN